MKVPFKWLKDYVEVNISAKELGDELTLSGSNVEEVIVTGDQIINVVTGKILEIEQHPDADKLSVCQVQVGENEDEVTQIVTGATNMKVQDVVPVALHGAVLADGMKIKKGKLRGVVSNGMFCSEVELGIATEEEVHGLLIFPQGTPAGKDVKEVLQLSNAIIDFEITSNRPDCLSVLGMAREAAATLGVAYSAPSTEYRATCDDNVEDMICVEIKDELCRRYMARGIKNVKIQPSPTWMQEKLIDAGVRPINNIVDITNFVMLELGQPMHAFDKRQISSNKIAVERAAEQEKFTTLDEIERQLNETVLCIKDDTKTIALAGIMGGLNSQIKEDTQEVIFECANFEGKNIRVNSKNLGLRTESSSRFEKDLDPNLVQMAMDRACNLVNELNAGEIMTGTIDVYNEKRELVVLDIDYKWINKILGTDIELQKIKEYLERLEFIVKIDGDNMNITAPSFRGDILIREDIAEEVARIYGYNNIPTTQVASIGKKSGKNKKQILDDIVIENMLSNGINQSISYAFISPKVFDLINAPADSLLRNTVKIKNPLGEDYSIMRTTTIPSMLESLGRNYARSNEVARLFEIGRVYIPNEDETKLPEERNILTIGIFGGCDYFDLKGVAENLCDALGVTNCSYRRETENSTFHPGKTAALFSGKEVVGVLGEIHPDVSENYEIDVPCYIAEFNLDILYKNSKLEREYKPLPKYPAVTRDIALLVEDEILVAEIEEIITKQGGAMVEKINLFDVYKGEQIPEGKKSIAYSIVYRLQNKTLTDNEVNKVHEKILKTLEYKLGAQLR